MRSTPPLRRPTTRRRVLHAIAYVPEKLVFIDSLGKLVVRLAMVAASTSTGFVGGLVVVVFGWRRADTATELFCSEFE